MEEKSTFWEEIRCDYLDEHDGYWTVDAWKSFDNPDEEGEVIAVIDADTAKVYYINKLALWDTYAQEVIKKKRDEILNR